MKENVLDIPKIQKDIHEKHNQFIKDYASQIDKVAADHKLLSDIAAAKLYRISICFKEENIIDEIKISDEGYGKKITLIKSNIGTYVDIRTNGKSIVLEGYTFSKNDFISDLSEPKKIFQEVDSRDFGWIKFSNDLLSYIHNVIYGRKEASEEKIRNIFENPSNRKKKTK